MKVKGHTPKFSAPRPNNDKIVYQVITKGGGMDGMDHTDKGGDIKFASFDRNEAEKKVDGWTELKAVVVDVEEAKKAAREKLNGLDRLVLGID